MKMLLLLLAAALTASAASHPAVVSAGFINDNPPYPESHASSIVELAPGRLAATWFGGTKERNPDVVIWFARHEGGQWQPAVEVANGVQPALRQAQGSKAEATRQPCWNPVLFAPKGAPLHLFYKVGPNPREWWGEVITSTDGGKTWSKPRRLPDGFLGPIKNKPVVLADGSWLSPSSTEGNKDGWLVHFERSRDQGATWEMIGPVKKGPSLDNIQPSILFHQDGKLQVLTRTKQGVVGQTWSEDGGQTWSPFTATELPNPASGTDAVTLADGRQLIVYNPTGHRPHEAKGNRYPIAVAVSADGLSWNKVVTLDTEPCQSGYSYPAVIQTTDGLVHITYTFNREKIKHVVLDPKKL
ncbi:sialidase [Oleiharenicola lentus]|uniref:Sialidase n=1 Tax=Oleiharenicola lentus TaxID=2508720 RepID=A0A4Q1C5B9_9BACT|nr:sialidase family protein [Oleiharenicola lentus]RXK53632.1 sialidase [Oleiharenicola lentus]